MQHQHFTPVAPQERIQAIDIIRGIALFGILVINFTVDDGQVSPMEGWTSFGNQLVWWTVRLFMDDRFQTIYCLLFGLGFAIQMQRAADRNSPFVFLFLRRMIALYLIGSALQILTGIGYFVISWYAMVGVLLIFFIKVPTRFLPTLAVFFFLLATTRETFVFLNAQSKVKKMIENKVAVDTTILDKYVGVFENQNNQRLIVLRKEDSLIGEGPGRRFILTPLSDSHFIRTDFNHILTFKKDSVGKLNLLEVKFPDGRISKAKRIDTDLQQALEKQLKQRASGGNQQNEPSTYKKFIYQNATNLLNNHKNFSLIAFFWRNNSYPIGYILVLFLLGAYIGRKKHLYDIASNKDLFSNMFKWGVIIGGILAAANIGFDAWNYFQHIKFESYPYLLRAFMGPLWNISIILMALGYISGIALLAEKANWKRRLSIPAAVGRLGLTSYILHAVAYVLIFEKFIFCLGLYGKIGPLYRLLFAILVYTVLYFFSRWWLKKFRIGPFEWLWRSLTYLKFQPMRLETKDSAEIKE